MANTNDDVLVLSEDDLDAAHANFQDWESSQAGMPDEATALANIKTNSTIGVLVSNIKAVLLRFKTKIDDKLDKTSVVNNLTTTIVGSALDATQGKLLNDNKFNKSNIISSLNATSDDYIVGGKTCGDAINALNTALEWKKLVTCTDNTSKTISLTGYKEIEAKIFINLSGTLRTVTIRSSVNVEDDGLLSAGSYYYGGSYLSTNSYTSAQIFLSSNSFIANQMVVNGTTYTSGFECILFAR